MDHERGAQGLEVFGDEVGGLQILCTLLEPSGLEGDLGVA